MDCAIIRMIVDDPDLANQLFNQNSFSVSETELMVVSLPRGKRALLTVWTTLMAGEVNILYTYPLLVHPPRIARHCCAGRPPRHGLPGLAQQQVHLARPVRSGSAVGWATEFPHVFSDCGCHWQIAASANAAVVPDQALAASCQWRPNHLPVPRKTLSTYEFSVGKLFAAQSVVEFDLGQHVRDAPAGVAVAVDRAAP